MGAADQQLPRIYKNNGPKHRPRPHGCHPGPRGPATPPRRPSGAQWTGHAPTAAIRGPGDRPRPHGSHPGPRGPATPPHEAQGTGHAPTAAIRGPGDQQLPRLICVPAAASPTVPVPVSAPGAIKSDPIKSELQLSFLEVYQKWLL